MKTKEELPACPVATAVSLIGGKWKLLILRNLKTRPWRFNELQRDLEGISQKVLTELTADDRRRARLPTRLSRNAPSRGVWPDQPRQRDASHH